MFTIWKFLSSLIVHAIVVVGFTFDVGILAYRSLKCRISPIVANGSIEDKHVRLRLTV